MSAKLVEFPTTSLADIPKTLRKLADDIEANIANEAKSTKNLVWVASSEEYGIEVGMLGKCGLPIPEAHYLLALGMKYLEDIDSANRNAK